MFHLSTACMEHLLRSPVLSSQPTGVVNFSVFIVQPNSCMYSTRVPKTLPSYIVLNVSNCFYFALTRPNEEVLNGHPSSVVMYSFSQSGVDKTEEKHDRRQYDSWASEDSYRNRRSLCTRPNSTKQSSLDFTVHTYGVAAVPQKTTFKVCVGSKFFFLSN